MVVVALLGILLGLAAPSFSGALQRQRERSTAQELHDALELGRAEATVFVSNQAQSQYSYGL